LSIDVQQSNSLIVDSILIDQFTMTVSNYYSHNTPVLSTNKTYKLVADGRYGFADYWSHNDAAWSYAWDTITGTKVFCNGTQDAELDIRWGFDGANDFQRPDNDIDNNINNAFCQGIDKTYFWTIPGDGISHSIEWVDGGGYGDNTGSLNFKLYELVTGSVNANSILWSTGDTTAGITISPTETTTYYVSVSNGIIACMDSVLVEVTCEVDGGVLSTVNTTDNFCVGDGEPNFIEVNVSGNEGLFGRYGIMNANTQDLIGGNNNGIFNLENYPPGAYTIGYVSYNQENFFTGKNNVSDLEGCYDISNSLSVSTFSVEAGEIFFDGATTVCLDDDLASILSFGVIGSTGPKQRWAVLNEDGSSVLSNNSSGTFNFDFASEGIYQVVHVAWGNLNPASIDLQDPNGCVDFSDPIFITVENCQAGLVELTSTPNPVAEISSVEFVLPSSDHVRLEVYDTSGSLIESLFSGIALTDEVHRLQFDTSALPQGVYLYRLTSDQTVVTEKFIVSR